MTDIDPRVLRQLDGLFTGMLEYINDDLYEIAEALVPPLADDASSEAADEWHDLLDTKVDELIDAMFEDHGYDKNPGRAIPRPLVEGETR